MKSNWTAGNSARLLENGEAFFPAVFDAIRAARREVMLETFIVFEDKVGLELHAALCAAARRGVRVDVMVDGFGSSDLGAAFTGELSAAGVQLRSFDPSSRLFGIRFNPLRRMHRKLVVVDAERAFVGGINFSADHLGDFGPEAKEDFAVELEGPIVGEIHRFMVSSRATGTPPAAAECRGRTASAAPVVPEAGSVEALFVTRDNAAHRTDIEQHYRAAIRNARRQVVIANAYFFPGYRLLRELVRATRRGIDVQLILQGEPDMAIAKTAAMLLYEHLQRHGVKIYEYCRRPLHGKVAVIDDDWSTVGSSNLDPFSLSLNLEANVILRDAAFAADLRERLGCLIDDDCKEIGPLPAPRWRLWQRWRTTLVFHFLRHFPAWANQLSWHAPKLEVTEFEVERVEGATTQADARADESPADEPPAGGAALASPHGITAQPWWPVAKRIVTVLFLLGVLALVFVQARNVDWPVVAGAVADYSMPVLLGASGLCALSYAVYCTYDLIGRHVVGHELRRTQVIRVGFVSYAFNLNLGALIGGVALRYRLYSRLGLKTDVIAQVYVLSLVTNWLGYLFLAGGVFLLWPLALPPEWRFGSGGLRLLGALLLAIAVLYPLLCAMAKRREWTVRGHTIHLPSLRIALLQLALSSANWLSIAAAVWVLLQFRIDYASVLSVLLVAAVAGVVAQVPAGLGVLEAVFIALLLNRSSQGELLAALLIYRLLYYLVPLALATVVFLVSEARGKVQPPCRPRLRGST